MKRVKESVPMHELERRAVVALASYNRLAGPGELAAAMWPGVRFGSKQGAGRCAATVLRKLSLQPQAKVRHDTRHFYVERGGMGGRQRVEKYVSYSGWRLTALGAEVARLQGLTVALG